MKQRVTEAKWIVTPGIDGAPDRWCLMVTVDAAGGLITLLVCSDSVGLGS